MSTFRQILYHIVFSTKDREPALQPAFHDDLYRYTWGVIKKRQSHLYRINGMEDHLHIVSDLHPSICLSDFVKEIKAATNT